MQVLTTTTPLHLGFDPSVTAKGATVFATLSYRLWAPEAPVAPAMYHK